MKTLVLSPAYGRDYKSRKAVLTDWDGNLDFRICNLIPLNGAYVNKQQVEQLRADGYSSVEFRYSKLTKCFIINLDK